VARFEAEAAGRGRSFVARKLPPGRGARWNHLDGILCVLAVERVWPEELGASLRPAVGAVQVEQRGCPVQPKRQAGRGGEVRRASRR